MKTLLAVVAVLGLVAADKPKEEPKVTGPLDFKMTGINGKEVDLAKFKGKVVLLVNVASKCGYTGQYQGLQELYDEYEKAGLVVVGVPANDFGKQEPGSDADISEFCKTNYKVTFPMMSKVSVKGDAACPLYKYLTGKDTNPKFPGAVAWNFEKFLIGRDGQVAGRFKSGVEPGSDELKKAVAAELAKK